MGCRVLRRSFLLNFVYNKSKSKATFSVGGSPWTQSGWTIGSDLTQFDADAAAIAKAVEVLVAFYCSDGAPPPLLIFSYLRLPQVPCRR